MGVKKKEDMKNIFSTRHVCEICRIRACMLQAVQASAGKAVLIKIDDCSIGCNLQEVQHGLYQNLQEVEVRDMIIQHLSKSDKHWSSIYQ